MPLHQVEIVGIQQFIRYIDNNTQLSFARDVELITIRSIAKSRNKFFILSMENNYMRRQYITYKDSIPITPLNCPTVAR